MSHPWAAFAMGLFLGVMVLLAACEVAASWLIGRVCGTNTRVEAAEDAAREAELQQIVEAGR